MPASANESSKFNSTTEQKYQRNDVKTTDDPEESSALTFDLHQYRFERCWRLSPFVPKIAHYKYRIHRERETTTTYSNVFCILLRPLSLFLYLCCASFVIKVIEAKQTSENYDTISVLCGDCYSVDCTVYITRTMHTQGPMGMCCWNQRKKGKPGAIESENVKLKRKSY